MNTDPDTIEEEAEIEVAAATLPEPEPPATMNLPAVIDPDRAFMPVAIELIDEAARFLATCPGLAREFKEFDNCRAIAYQAARWGLDPVAVAGKAYFANGRIGYEAQLVHALIEKNGDLREPLQFEYGYGGDKQKIGPNRFVKVIGWIQGASRPASVTTPTVAQIKIKNSPLWFSDPDQQLAYYGARAWARRHRPGAILGIYAKEEVQNISVIGETGEPRRPMFEEEEIHEAEFEDSVPQTAADLAAHARAEAKANGEQDSRDPRDAPRNKDPVAGPGGVSEPADMPAVREWAAAEQTRLLGLPLAELKIAWEVTRADTRWRRLKSYDQPTANAIYQTIKAKTEGKS